MNPEPLPVDFKSPWNPERTHGRFDLGYSCLTLDGSRSVAVKTRSNSPKRCSGTTRRPMTRDGSSVTGIRAMRRYDFLGVGAGGALRSSCFVNRIRAERTGPWRTLQSFMGF